MAPFLSRLFSNRKRHCKSQYIDDFTSDSNSWSPPSFSSEQQVRMLLFQESDCRVRKLLFDSKSVKKKPSFENNTKSSNKFSHLMKMNSTQKSPEKVSEKGDSSRGTDSSYVFLKPSSDVRMLGEMMFGSVAMSYLGISTKLHTIRSPPQLMISIVFPAPNPDTAKYGRGHLDGSGSLHNSASELTMSLSIEKAPPVMARSVCMDVPGCSSHRLDIPANTACSSLHSDVSGSSLSFPVSVGSSTSSLTQSASYSNLQRRWLRNMTTSMEYGSLSRATRSLSSDEPGLPARKRVKLGLSVIISLNENNLEEAKHFRGFFFDHISLIEGHIFKLKEEVCKACLKRVNFVHSVHKAFSKLQSSLQDLYAAPRLPSPVWLTLTSIVTSYHQHCSRFISELVALLQEFDNKQTNFFVTTLLTAVLTHHLSWVPTVTPPAIPTRHNYRKRCTAGWVESIAKSHPYNPLWMQLGDLYGAVNHPCTLSKTVVVGKKANVILRFLYVLSYFIRCSDVCEKIQEMVYCPEKKDTTDGNERLDANTSHSTAVSSPEKSAVHDSQLPLTSVHSSVYKSPAQMLADQLSSKSSVLSYNHPMDGQKQNHCSKDTVDCDPSTHYTSNSIVEQNCTHNTNCSKTVNCSPPATTDFRTLNTKFCSKSSEKLDASISKINDDVVFLLGESPLSEHFSSHLKTNVVQKANELQCKSSHLSRDSPGVDSLGYGSLVETGELNKQEDAFLQKSLSTLKAFQDIELLNENSENLKDVEYSSSTVKLDNGIEENAMCKNTKNLACPETSSSEDDSIEKSDIEQNCLNQTLSVSNEISKHSPETLETLPIHNNRVDCVSVNCVNSDESDNDQNFVHSESHIVNEQKHPKNPSDFIEKESRSVVHDSKLYIQVYHSIRFASESRKTLIKDYIENLAHDNNSVQNCVPSVCVNSHPISSATSANSFADVIESNKQSDGAPEEGYISMEEPTKQASVFPCLSLSERLKAEDNQIPPGSVELPLLGLSERDMDYADKKGFGWSLLAGVTDHYMADFCLQGVHGTVKESEIKKDLLCSVQFPVLGEPVAEAVCVLADTDVWKVKLLSSDYMEDKTGSIAVTLSPLVSNLCESVLQMCRLKMPPEFCLMHLEDRLQELYFHSLSLVDLQKDKKSSHIEEAVKVLKIEPSDLPLLKAVASTLRL